MRGTPKSSIEIGISTVNHQFYADLPLMETLHLKQENRWFLREKNVGQQHVFEVFDPREHLQENIDIYIVIKIMGFL